MLNFDEIQHRVASLTLESITTFTRHHAFLKKFDQNFHPVGVICLGNGDPNFHPVGVTQQKNTARAVFFLHNQ